MSTEFWTSVKSIISNNIAQLNLFSGGNPFAPLNATLLVNYG